jgi:hypothetical protein
MSHKGIDHYAYCVTWSPEDEEYLALCVEFPSLSRLASNPGKALAGIRKVVSSSVVEMNANGASANP